MTELQANLKRTHSHHGEQQLAAWRLAAAGLSASLVGIGLALGMFGTGLTLRRFLRV